ncbi:MAG: AbrB/MazE/SpoVT family DNA-binding domain-containing protein [Acidobacteriaceae bacterium]|jgi:AbrB family looped-hinge helix DNA binding protein
MASQMTRMGENGRVVIPAPIREAMGLKPGDALEVSFDEYGVRLQTLRQQFAQARAVLRKYVEPGRSLSAELIAERRLEAKRERQR